MEAIVTSVVCYNNEDEVLSYAKEISRQQCEREIVLVITCNGCKDVELLTSNVHAILPNAKVFDPQRNLGYLPGCLYGISHLDVEYKWAMISNTDIRFEDERFFCHFLDSVPSGVWCVGPNIVLSATGEHQNPFLVRHPSRKQIEKWRIIYSNSVLFYVYYKLSRLKKKYKKSKNENDLSGSVYAVHGSCFALSKECVQQLADIQIPLFMYEEELFLAEMVKTGNGTVHYCRDAVVFHDENLVTGRVSISKKLRWIRESYRYMYNMF